MASNSTVDSVASPATDEEQLNIDELPIIEEDKKKIKKWFQENGKGQMEILITGWTGVGKSTLVNSLVGQQVAKEGDKLDSQTKNVKDYRVRAKEGVDVVVWDSPGLQNGMENEKEYLTELEKKCSNVDIIMYCINLSATRSELGEKQNELWAIKKLTNVFGPEWWKHSVFVMTFANIYEARLELEIERSTAKHHEQELNLKEMFLDRMKDWKERIYRALSVAGVPEEVVKNIPILPAGIDIRPHLQVQKFWLSKIWFSFLLRAKPQCQVKLVNLSKSRLKTESDASDEEFKREGIKQPIIVLRAILEVIANVASGLIRGVKIEEAIKYALYGASKGALIGAAFETAYSKGIEGGINILQEGTIKKIGVGFVAGSALGATAAVFIYYLNVENMIRM